MYHFSTRAALGLTVTTYQSKGPVEQAADLLLAMAVVLGMGFSSDCRVVQQ